LIGQMRIHDAIEQTMALVRNVNTYIERQAPWKVVKTDLARTGTILYTATEALRIAAVFLSPVMPEKVKQVLDVLGDDGASTAWGGLKPGVQMKIHEALFPRIEVEKTIQ